MAGALFIEGFHLVPQHEILAVLQDVLLRIHADDTNPAFAHGVSSLFWIPADAEPHKQIIRGTIEICAAGVPPLGNSLERVVVASGINNDPAAADPLRQFLMWFGRKR